MSTRIELATARARSRRAQDEHTAAKLAVKRRLLEQADGWKGLGTNDKERELVLDLAIEDDATCQQTLAELRHWQADVDRLQAEVDDEIDTRRCLERATRDRLSTAFEAVVLMEGAHHVHSH